MQRTISAAIAALTVAGGITIATALPSQAATCYAIQPSSTTQTVAKNNSCTAGATAWIKYITSSGTNSTKYGNKAYKGEYTVVTSPSSMTVGHGVKVG